MFRQWHSEYCGEICHALIQVASACLSFKPLGGCGGVLCRRGDTGTPDMGDL